MQREDESLIQGEWVQKISVFNMVWHDAQLRDRPRFYQEKSGFQPSRLNVEDMSMTWHNELMEDAMMEEYHNDVWDIVLKPKIKSVVSSKWVCKIKYVSDGSKARFVAKGFSQREGIDYEEAFAPVARYTSIRAIIALASMMKWDLH